MTPLTPEQGLAAFERNAGRIVNLLAGADLDAPVEHCPGWTLVDLVRHTGEIHQWARHAIVAGTPDGVAIPPEATDRDTVTGWYAEAATALADVLRSTDPDAPAWNFGPKPRTAGFWFRRQAHETAVHLWDAETSQGRITGVDHALALDGIDEVVTMFFPRQVRLGRIAPRSGALALAAGDESWLLTGDGTPGRSRTPDATVSGPADVVLLLLWKRTTLADDRLTLSGDAAAAHEVLDAGIVP